MQNFPNDDIGKMFGANSITCDFEKDIVNDSIRVGRVYCYETDENNEFCHVLKGYSSILKCNESYMDRYIGLDSGSFYYNTISLTMEEVNRIASQKIFIQSSAVISPDSSLGPNVYIGKGVKIGPGVRIKNSIILGGSEILGYSYISNTIIGWNCKIGPWARLEGNSIDDDKTINVLGVGIVVEAEAFINNCVIMPYKTVTNNHSDETII